MNPFTQLALPATIEDYVAMRNQAIADYATVLAVSAKIEKDMSRLMSWHGMPYQAKPQMSEKEFRQEIDSRLWQHTYRLTGMQQFMDEQAKSEFTRSLENDPPEFTVANIRSQFLTAQVDAKKFFYRGVVNLFLKLSGIYRSNDPFKIGKRLVMSYSTEHWNGNITVSYSHGADRVNDLDRVVQTIIGNKFEQGALVDRINASFKECHNAGERAVYDDDVYRIKGFRNGNLHVQIKDQSIIDAVNRIIADYYQNGAIADGRAA